MKADWLKLVTLVAIFCSETIRGKETVSVSFDPPVVSELYVDAEFNVTLSITGDVSNTDNDITIIAKPEFNLAAEFLPEPWNCNGFVCNRTFKVIGRFLGFGKVHVLQRNGSRSFENISSWTFLQPPLEVTILRQNTLLNNLFLIFVATVVTINYINFGCALDVEVVKKVLKRPIGPAVGFACQFVIMPLVAYGVGYLLLSDPVLWLGLFTFGCSPGGGASNMWTVLLEGNLNLSITMTFVSSVAAFGTIPLWVFTLGRTILADTTIVIPYRNIMFSLLSLLVPISIGLLVQRYLPKVAARSKRVLAPVCIVLIVAIIVMASVANTYIFSLLSWRIVLAASACVWSGFLGGLLASAACRFPAGDLVAVAVETGVQNTGIAFVLLSYSLAPPVSEMAGVVPVAASLVTPLPLFAVYLARKARNCWCRSEGLSLRSAGCDPCRSTARIVGDGELKYMN